MPPRPRAPKTPEEALSRALARTLRHAAKQQGIPQDQYGWCKLDDLLSHAPYNSMKATREAILATVASDKKKRYELSEDLQKIRAVQGHSVEVDVGLVPITTQSELPSALVHGTYYEAWESIKASGLSKMGRTHIHMASGLPGNAGVISGMRAKSEIYIYINGPKALEDGIPILKASNGAFLSPGINGYIPVAYFARVTDSTGSLLYEGDDSQIPRTQPNET